MSYITNSNGIIEGRRPDAVIVMHTVNYMVCINLVEGVKVYCVRPDSPKWAVINKPAGIIIKQLYFNKTN